MKKIILWAGEAGKSEPIGVRFDMEDGKPAIDCMYAQLTEENKLYSRVHGISQKVGDSAANAKKQPNPKEWARSQIEATVQQLYTGPWSEAGGGGGTSDLAQAIKNVSPELDLADIIATLNEGDDDAQAATRKVYMDQPKVKLALMKIKRAREDQKMADLEKKAAEEDAKKAAATA